VGGGGSSGNRVNTTPATISTWVWPGRKRARRGTRLLGWDEAPEAEESGWRRRAVAELRLSIARDRRRRNRGKRPAAIPSSTWSVGSG
jgi:hypothetical protein